MCVCVGGNKRSSATTPSSQLALQTCLAGVVAGVGAGALQGGPTTAG